MKKIYNSVTKHNRSIFAVLAGSISLAAIFFIGNSFYSFGNVLGVSNSPWTQTDWNGGVASGTVSDTVTTYASSSDIDSSTSGELKLEKRYEKASFFGDRLASGSTNLNTGTAEKIQFNVSQEFDDGSFSYSGGQPTRITLDKSGNYLLSLTMPLLSSSNGSQGVGRQGVEASIFVNGTKKDVGIARSTYIRNNSGHVESSLHFTVPLIGISASDYIEINLQATSALTFDLSSTYNLYVENIPDAEAIFSATATQKQSGTNLNSAASPIVWTENANDTGFDHDDVTNPYEITISDPGEYFLSVNVPLGDTSPPPPQRGNITGRVKLNGTMVNGGAFQQGYIRTYDGHEESSIHWNGHISTVANNEILTIDLEQSAAGGNIDMDNEKATMYIQRLNNESLFVAEATQVGGGTNWNPTTKSTINWATELVEDGNIFEHDTVTNNQNIKVLKDGDYLLAFNAAFYGTATRANPKITIQVNGVDATSAEAKSAYIRNASGHNESSNTMYIPLFGLSENDVITVSVFREAGAGTVNLFSGTPAKMMLWFKGYANSGELVSNIFDAGADADWGVLNYTSSGTGTVNLKVRTDSNSDMSGAGDWSTCGLISSGSDISSETCVSDSDRYFQYQVELSPSGGQSPVFEDISIAFSPTDQVPPTVNATNVIMSGYNNGDWVNSYPQLSWDAGADDGAGSGVFGYCIALDEQDNLPSGGLDPAITGGILTGIDDGVESTACPYIFTGVNLDLSTITGLNLQSGKFYFFSIKTIDNAENIYTGAISEYQDLISFRYDDLEPDPPGYVSMPTNYLASKNAIFSWPPSGVGSPADTDSGLAGLQYRIGDTGTWYGDIHNGSEDMSDLLSNDGSYITDPTYDYPLLLEGSNIIYFRSVDNAGNYTSSDNYVKGILKINTVAPSEPKELSVTPIANSINSFAFYWNAPDFFTGQESNLIYCYTINTLPSPLTCNYTNPGETYLIADAYASQPGENSLYVATRDEAGNINYNAYSSVAFEYSGVAPGLPKNVDVNDISIKSTQNWRLVISWDEPDAKGSGIEYYKIYRTTTNTSCSANFTSFTEIGTSASTSYIDTDLNQEVYYYCVKTCDNANSCSAVSETKNLIPTGKFTEPARAISSPEVVAVTSQRAVIEWVTERDSDTRVQYGFESGVYFDEEVSNSDQVSIHNITLNNLSPGSTYYYRTLWNDVDGNQGASEEKTFVTLPPPEITTLRISDVGLNSARITFGVKDATKATILYGPTQAYGGVQEIATSTLESTYSIILDNLSDNTLYNFKFNLLDLDGFEYQGTQNNQFQTLPQPKISNLQIQEVIGSAQPSVDVFWDTNVPTSSTVSYYPVDRPDQKRDQVGEDLITEHKVNITNLSANTKYELVVRVRDFIGNEVESEKYIFTTAADSRPPSIDSIKVDTRISSNTDLGSDSQAQLIVSWNTDEPADGQIEFGEGTIGTYTQKTQVDGNFGYNHVVVISNLRPASVYHMRIISHDTVGNMAESKNIVTITAQANENPVELILGRLGEIFQFLN